MARHAKHRPMSARRLRWLLNLYPPWWFQRIRVVALSEDLSSCRVEVRPSWRSRNLGGSTFGGTIFAAGDPVVAVLFWQILANRGVPVEAWLKSAKIRYRRPARTTLTLDFVLERVDVEEAVEAILREGRWSRWYRVDAVDRDGKVCAEMETEVFLRRIGSQTESET